MIPKNWKMTVSNEAIWVRLPAPPVTPLPPQVIEIERAILRRLLRERPIRPA